MPGIMQLLEKRFFIKLLFCFDDEKRAGDYIYYSGGVFGTCYDALI